jgi:hypothetical protein
MSSLSSLVTPSYAAFHPIARPAILLQGDPGCVALEPSGTLLVGDAYGGAIVRIDGDYQRRLATIDSGGVVGNDRLGGLTVAPDGTVYAARIGNGQAGAIFRISADGRSEALANVPPKAWRGALAHDGTHLYATQYFRSRSGAFDGSIVEVDAGGTCSNVIDGFLHPTGLVAMAGQLVIADARQRAVFKVDVAGGRGVFRLQLSADVDRPDSLCACDYESVLLTSFDDEDGIGKLRRIWLDGKTKVIAQGPWEPRGVVTDGDRVFVATRRTGGVMVFDLESRAP